MLDKEIVDVLEKSKETIKTLMSCNEISNIADIIGKETLEDINKILKINLENKITKRKVKCVYGKIQSFWTEKDHSRNHCGCGSNLCHYVYDGKNLYSVCNACEEDLYTLKYDDDYIKNSEWEYIKKQGEIT